MSAHKLLLALALVTGPLIAGCTEPGGLPRLSLSVADTEVEWGQAAQLTIKNTGEGLAPAPITLEIISENGTVVRTYEDLTGGRGIAAGGQLTVGWNGTNDAGRPVLWGTYRMSVEGYEKRAIVELLEPDNFAITIDPIPRTAAPGEEIEFRVNNTGNVWLNGTITMAAGREDTVLYSNEVDVQLAPGEGYSAFWSGEDPDGKPAEPKKYLVAARMELDRDGPTPFAQDVFEVTQG